MKKIIITLLLVISCTVSPVFAAPQESMEEKSLNAYLSETISHILQIANNELGYIEKSSNQYLYDKTANVGTANYTKYAVDLYNWGFYPDNLNGYAWCDMFVDWCFCTAFGVANAKDITYQDPYGSAGCSVSASFYQSVGQFYKTPQPGDQVFFSTSHTGLIYKVNNNIIYTIEGNTIPGNGVVANGDGVIAKSYNISSQKIIGYGRPNYLKIAQTKKKEYDEQQEKEKIRLIIFQPYRRSIFSS